MIFDKLENLNKYENINPSFKDVINFIKNNDLHSLKVEKKVINKKVWYNSQEYIGKENKNIFESHIKYIDIQVVIDGDEYIFYSKENPLIKETNEKDCYFTSSLDMFPLKMSRGTFAIFFPGELHNPGIKINDKIIKKVVFKVEAK